MRTRAEDLGGSHLLALNLHPRIAVVGLDDLIGHHAHVLLDHLVGELTADQPLDRGHRVGGVGDGLTLGGLPHQHFAVLGEGNDRRRRPIALTVLDDLGLAALHDRDAGIGRAEIDANHFTHGENPLNIRYR